MVELSIVLVILGLLVGGVLAGQSLIRAAELRAVSREFQQYQTALGAFKDKYFALPGDMPNAVKYWGAQAGATTDGKDSTCAALTTAATGTATCNGDGDGKIANTTTNDPYEVFRAWQHLANAGMIEGSYSGVRGPNAIWHGIPGTNVPRSKVSGGGWSILAPGIYAGDVNWFNVAYGNVVVFGGIISTSLTFNPLIKAEEAYNIDMKMDDGQPHLGRVLTMKNAWNPNCVPASNDAYSLSSTTANACPLIFMTGY